MAKSPSIMMYREGNMKNKAPGLNAEQKPDSLLSSLPARKNKSIHRSAPPAPLTSSPSPPLHCLIHPLHHPLLQLLPQRGREVLWEGEKTGGPKP